MTEYAENDQHDFEKVYFYKDDCLVAELNMNSDVFTSHIEMTEDEADRVYKAMVLEHESYVNEFELS